MSVSNTSSYLLPDLWVKIYQNPDPAKRIQSLTLFARKGCPVAIATLFENIEKIVIADKDKAMIREKYAELPSNLGRKLFSCLKDVGHTFHPEGHFWKESLQPSFWEGARKVQRLFFCRMLVLEYKSAPEQELPFEETLELVISRAPSANIPFYRYGIKALYGDHTSLLGWILSLVVSVSEGGRFHPSEEEQEQLKEGERLLSLLIRERLNPTKEEQFMKMVSRFASFQILRSLNSIEDPTIILERLRFCCFLFDLKGPYRCRLLAHDVMIMFAHILRLSPDLTERTKSVQKLAEVELKIRRDPSQDYYFHPMLCERILSERNHARDLFVEAIGGETPWLEILQIALKRFASIPQKDHKARDLILLPTLLSLEELISCHTSQDKPIPESRYELLDTLLSDQELLNEGILQALETLEGNDVERFFLPYAVLYAKTTPFFWLSIAKALHKLPTLKPKYQELMEQCKREPVISCALLYLHQPGKTYPPEAKEWADIVSSYVETMHPRDEHEEKTLYIMLFELYHYQVEREGIGASSRRILHQIKQRLPSWINDTVHAHTLFDDLLQCSSTEDVISFLRQLEGFLSNIDVKTNLYCFAASLLITGTLSVIYPQGLLITDTASAPITQKIEQLIMYHKETYAPSLSYAFTLIQKVLENLSPQRALTKATANPIKPDVPAPLPRQEVCERVIAVQHSEELIAGEAISDKIEPPDMPLQLALNREGVLEQLRIERPLVNLNFGFFRPVDGGKAPALQPIEEDDDLFTPSSEDESPKNSSNDRKEEQLGAFTLVQRAKKPEVQVITLPKGKKVLRAEARRAKDSQNPPESEAEKWLQRVASHKPMTGRDVRKLFNALQKEGAEVANGKGTFDFSSDGAPKKEMHGFHMPHGERPFTEWQKVAKSFLEKLSQPHAVSGTRRPGATTLPPMK